MIRFGVNRISCFNTSRSLVTSTTERDKLSSKLPLDSKISMAMLRKSFKAQPGLQANRNRNLLVKNFFDFSKSVLDKKLDADEFTGTKTFNKLEEQVEFNIDNMSNAQLVSLLASAVKMRISPSTDLVRLLEHEVKFRLNSLNLNQLAKLHRFYGNIEMNQEQKEVCDLLGYRIRAVLQSDEVTLPELVEALSLLAAEQISKSHLPLVEEKALNLLTSYSKQHEGEEDDMVSKYLNRVELQDYETLCQLFVKLAENHRRPPPILKAAAVNLCRLAIPTDVIERPKQETIISTLAALVSLKYPNRSLVSKLFNDLVKVVNLNDLDSIAMCNLLRTVVSLRWRNPELLDKFYDHIYDNKEDLKRIDHNLVLTLLHSTALLNFRPSRSILEFHTSCMSGKREEIMDPNSKKWLNYVWTLTALNICKESHIRSVLSPEYLRSNLAKMGYTDKLKLLNLMAVGKHEFKIENTSLDSMVELDGLTIKKSNDMQRLSLKINEAVSSIVGKTPDMLSKDIQLPYGFLVDCEIFIDDQLEPTHVDGQPNLGEIFSDTSEVNANSSPGARRCALIYLSYEETVANSMSEPVGHKKIISRLLKYKDCATVFLPEPVLTREKTSADLINKIRTIIKNSLPDSKTVT